MAKKQRGKASSSSKTADIEKPTKSFTLSLESSDDEAPEEVTFEDSKAEALRSMKQALDTARREKQLLKEKRRKRQELFQEQKKRKLLSADVLEEIDSAFSKKQKQSEDEGEQEEKPEKEGGDGKKKKKKKRSGKLANARNLKGKYTVTTVKERTLASFQQQVAEEFIQSRLYGPGTCRTTSELVASPYFIFCQVFYSMTRGDAFLQRFYHLVCCSLVLILSEQSFCVADVK
ncbi:nucleolar protein 7 [Neolamprologus brichardi]|uniref:nucleolar protein 7 n=1 Tax=Neolamprologus brichardi TaxID=32507 RepID=UPI0003EC4771|nr:nucleolar protein 7 [Neolamprologus brichardi]